MRGAAGPAARGGGWGYGRVARAPAVCRLQGGRAGRRAVGQVARRPACDRHLGQGAPPAGAPAASGGRGVPGPARREGRAARRIHVAARVREGVRRGPAAQGQRGGPGREGCRRPGVDLLGQHAHAGVPRARPHAGAGTRRFRSAPPAQRAQRAALPACSGDCGGAAPALPARRFRCTSRPRRPLPSHPCPRDPSAPQHP